MRRLVAVLLLTWGLAAPCLEARESRRRSEPSRQAAPAKKSEDRAVYRKRTTSEGNRYERVGTRKSDKVVVMEKRR